MATQIFNIWENMEAWDDVMGQMIAFVNDTHADVDMAYDWVCEMMDISSFVDNKIAWDSFYNTWESCDNRNIKRIVAKSQLSLGDKHSFYVGISGFCMRRARK